MNRIARSIALVTAIAVTVPGFLSTLAAAGASLDGIVQIPCDPSRLSEVAAVRLQPVAGGSATTVVVDPATGKFVAEDLAEGEYKLVAVGLEGDPMGTGSLSVTAGDNTIILTLEPPGCVASDAAVEGAADTPAAGGKAGLKDWQLTLIYVGAVGAVILALSDDDEEPASPF
jgi:hypothetical protein